MPERAETLRQMQKSVREINSLGEDKTREQLNTFGTVEH